MVGPIVVRSNFQAWPRPGGLDQQDPVFIEDFAVWLREKHLAEHKARQALKDEADAKEARAAANKIFAGAKSIRALRSE